MKCPNCNQEMIDIKDYCVNCGKRLRIEKKGITLGGLFLIFGIIMVITTLVCYMIANYNTKEEIKPYIVNKE